MPAQDRDFHRHDLFHHSRCGAYNTFLAFSQLPQSGAEWLLEQGFSPWTILVIILAKYVILGCIMDS